MVTDDEAITIASFNFDESELSPRSTPRRSRGLGSRCVASHRSGRARLVIPAMERGLIEIVPEYAGSAVAFLGGEPSADQGRTHDELAELFRARDIDVLDAAPAKDHNAVVVSAEVADSLSLRRISDLTNYAGGMTLGGPPECPDRDLCLPGLEDTYHLRFDSFLRLDGGSPSPPKRSSAARSTWA